MAKLVSLFGRFLTWWCGELAGLAPAVLRDRLGSNRRQLVIDWDRRSLRLMRFQGAQGETAGTIERGRRDEEAIPHDIKGYIGTPDPARDELVLRLPAAQALRKRIVLPLAAEPDLRQALGFQIERHTPFAADDIRFDYSVAERDAKAERLSVDLVVVPRSVVDEGLADVRRWGLEPDRVDVASGSPEAPPRYNLLGQRPGASGGRGRGAVNTGLAVLAVALLALAVTLPLQARRETAADLTARLAEARQRAAAVTSLTDRVRTLRQDKVFLSLKKRAKPPTVAILEDLSALIPDDTYLASLRVRAREVRVNGFSKSASALIALIENAALFEQPRFRAPVTQDPRSGRERFSLSFVLRGAEPEAEQ